MEQKASDTYKQVADEANEEHRVMTIPQTVGDALVGSIHKSQVGDRVHDLGAVDRSIVVLELLISMKRMNNKEDPLPLRTSSASTLQDSSIRHWWAHMARTSSALVCGHRRG